MDIVTWYSTGAPLPSTSISGAVVVIDLTRVNELGLLQWFTEIPRLPQTNVRITLNDMASLFVNAA